MRRSCSSPIRVRAHLLLTVLFSLSFAAMAVTFAQAQETEVPGSRLGRFYDGYNDQTTMKVTGVSLSGVMRPVPGFAVDLGLSGYYGLDASIGSSGGILDNNQLTFLAERSLAMKWADEQARDAVWFGGGEYVSLHVTLHGTLRRLVLRDRPWWVFLVSSIEVMAADGTTYATVQ